MTELISALRAETGANSVSPERVGYVLQQIVDLLPRDDTSGQPNEVVMNAEPYLNTTGASVTVGGVTVPGRSLYIPASATANIFVAGNGAQYQSKAQVLSLEGYGTWCIVFDTSTGEFEAIRWYLMGNMSVGKYLWAVISPFAVRSVLHINSWRYNIDGTVYTRQMPEALPATVASQAAAIARLQADVLAVRKLPMTTGTDTMDVGEEVKFTSDDESETYAKITPEGIYGKRFFTLDGARLATKNRSIKVLCFGNSFTQDSMSYVPAMLANVAPELDFVIGIAYKGGCSLAQHCANFTGEAQTLAGATVAVDDSYSYHKFTNNASSWSTQSGKTVDYMLAAEDWDVVTFQQNGAASFDSWLTYFEPFIYKLHKSLYDKIRNKTVKIGWLLTQSAYASSSDELVTRWQGTATNSKKVLDETATEVVFPFGTAVQNLRTVTDLAAAGIGGQYKDFRADGTGHLHEGIGTMCANYCNLLTILNLAGFENLSIIGEPTRVTKAWNDANGTPGPNYGNEDPAKVYGVTDDNVYTAQVAAIMAVKNPWEITDCTDFYTPNN